MDDPPSKTQQQRREQTEEGMWAVIRPFFNRRAAADNVAAANSSGLWKAPHVSQCCQWDCGVSCVQMVLRGLGREAERSSLLASLGTRSVWTIDLAMLLHRQGIRFMYGTRTAGVTEAYSTIDFYRANFDRDARRVQSLFKAAEEAKVGAVQKTFSWQELAVLVSSYNYAAIVLVDSRFLYPTSYRAPSPAAPAPRVGAPAVTPLTPPSPVSAASALPRVALFSPPPAAATAAWQGNGGGGGNGSGSPPSSWNTPKRNRDETGDRGDAWGWDLGGAGAAAAAGVRIGGPSRRRRKIPGAPADPSDLEGVESTGEHGGAAEQVPAAATATARSSAQQEDAPVESPAPLGRRDENTRHLRVSPAPHAIERGDDEAAAAVFATPPALQSGRKSLASQPSGVLRASDAPSATRKEDRESSPSARQSATTPTPVVGPSPCGTPRSSSPILLSSPPPLKAGTAPLNPPTATLPSPSPLLAANPDAGSPRPAPSPSQDSAYCGHYILLVGWSESERVFIARDPALPSSSSSSSTPFAVAGANGREVGGNADPSAHVCIALTPEALDRARRSYGTDEDVLVVDLARSRKGGVAAGPLAAAAAATALAASAASSAAAASAMVGLLAMAAAAAAGAEASGFKEWAWPDPAAWFAGQAADGDGTGGRMAKQIESEGREAREGIGGRREVVERRRGAPRNGAAESAAKRLASLLSLAASGLRFPTVGDAYRGPRVPWGNGAVGGGGGGGGSRGGGNGGGGGTDEEAEQERWAVRIASTMFVEGGRRAVYTLEGMLQGGRRAAYTMEGFLQGGALTMEGLLQGGAHTMEGLLQGGRRAAYTMEGLLEGGRRAAYNLRDQLADVADAPGGAGAECCSMAMLTSPGSPVAPSRLTAAVVSPA